MDGIIHPSIEQVCRKYIYKDEASAKIANFVHENLISAEDFDGRVRTYLMENLPYAPHWDTIAARLRVGDTHTEKSFNALDAPEQQCLRLRVLTGCSIPEIAATCRLTPQKVHAVLRAARYNFWKAFVISESHVLKKCRQHVYADTAAMEAAIASCSKSCSIPRTDVLAYLAAAPVSWENWDTLAILFKELDADTAAPNVQETFATLEDSEKALLRLRVVDGHTIAEIARRLAYTKEQAEASLIMHRTKFWRTLVKTDCILQKCRCFIHDDRDAEEIAVAFLKRGVKRGVPVDVRDYLVERWDPIPDWNDSAFIEVVSAVVDPTAPKSAGFEAAKTAYNLLEYPEQNFLKFKVEGVSDEIITHASMQPLNQVREKAREAKEVFWKLLTRERWSTLTYFIQELEELYEGDDPVHADILKVEEERLAAQKVYNSLHERDRAILKQRHLQGLSVEEIAAKQQVLPVEIAETLTEAREKFYQEFLAEIYRLWGLKTPTEIRGDEDHISSAWQTLQEQLYKFVPKNLGGFLTTVAQRSKLDAQKKEDPRRFTSKDGGYTYLNSEGKVVPDVIPPSPLQPDEMLEKEEAERIELAFLENDIKRWHALLTRTTVAILGYKRPEKKLYLLINYVLQPKLNELRGAKARVPHEFQKPGEAMAVSHVDHQYQSEVTQTWIGEPIDATDRSIRRYVGEIISLVEEAAEAVGIKRAELVAGCAPIKKNRTSRRDGVR